MQKTRGENIFTCDSPFDLFKETLKKSADVVKPEFATKKEREAL